MAPLFGRKPRPPIPTAPPPLPVHVIAAAPAAAAAPAVIEGRVLAQRYRLGRLLGEGGMATVHSARDLLLDRDVAVKLFRQDIASMEDLRLQETEARVVASLHHSALTTLFDAGVEHSPGGEQIYLVMEQVDGGDLRTRLRDGALTAEQVSWLGFDLAEALDHVHRCGLIHRDVKPANVLLSARSGAKRLRGKLTDFGTAALIGQPDDSEFTTGTAAYLSPEVIDGEDARPASDVYSLGLVLLEALTRKIEYPGSIETSAFARLDRDPVVPDHLHPAIARAISGMTARDPEDRIDLSEAGLCFQEYLVEQYVRARGI